MKFILTTILCTFGFHNYSDDRCYETNGKWWKIENVEKLKIDYVFCESCSKVKVRNFECGGKCDMNRKQRKYVYKACGEIVKQYVDTFEK